ncbi:MAG TPA: isochorismatase family protein [Steroidobacter sp.]
MKSALIVIDVQQSFTARPYWSDREVPQFVDRLNRLIDRAESAGIPVLQVFHVEGEEVPENPFSRASGLVRTLDDVRVRPEETFYKSVHSAMFASTSRGQTLDNWLRLNGIERVIITGIRTEQCCETTTRHASDLGYQVTYAIDATLTFEMQASSGKVYSASDIRERTELVLAGRFAEVMPAEAVAL